MKRVLFAACVAIFACLSFAAPAFAQDANEGDNPVLQLPWQKGPTTGRIGTRATIRIPEGYVFLDAPATRRLNELFENPSSDTDEYVVAPESLEWMAYFNFNDIGYVKDDETLDADDVLASIREGVEHGNEERRRRGWGTLELLGWASQPRYDTQLNALAWAVLLESQDTQSQVVNYNTRLLGRRGVMEVTLVADPDQLQPSIGDFKSLVPGYDFASGEKYSEFRPGDHVAEIGLAALITGGAAAVASKKSWLAAIGIALAKFWKLILIGIAGFGVALKKFFGRKDDDAAS